MVRLDSRHHAFIQALMNRGPLSEAEAQGMCLALFEGSNDGFFNILGVINKELDFVQMEIRAAADQYTGCLSYGLVNKLGNEQAKLGTQYSYAQIVFFKAVMEAVLQNCSGCVSSAEIFSLVLQQLAAVKLTPAEKEGTLRDLINDKWLRKMDDGSIGLGTRSFLELRTAFKDFDVPYCSVCNEAGIKAQPCSNEECSARLHTYCVRRMFSRKQVPRVCPSCKTAWDCSCIEEQLEEEEPHETKPKAKRLPRSKTKASANRPERQA